VSNWEESLTPEEQETWDAFVKHTREDAVQKIATSAFVVSIVPKEEPDIKFCVELGMSIMLDKPLVIVAMPGQQIPSQLRKVADRIIEADIDTEEGRNEFHRVVEDML